VFTQQYAGFLGSRSLWCDNALLSEPCSCWPATDGVGRALTGHNNARCGVIAGIIMARHATASIVSPATVSSRVFSSHEVRLTFRLFDLPAVR